VTQLEKDITGRVTLFSVIPICLHDRVPHGCVGRAGYIWHTRQFSFKDDFVADFVQLNVTGGAATAANLYF
jgi:hypothetical protein